MDLAVFSLIFSGFYFLGEQICRPWNTYFVEPFEALVFQTIFAASAWATKLTAFIVLPFVFLEIAIEGHTQ